MADPDRAVAKRRAVGRASRLPCTKTQVLTKYRGVGADVIDVEVRLTVQHHQHDQALLAFHDHVVMIGHKNSVIQKELQQKQFLCIIITIYKAL